MMDNKALVYDSQGRRVASVRGDLLYLTIHSERGHILQQAPGPGLAFNREVLQSARDAGAARIEVYDADTRRTYRATLRDLELHGVRFDLGWGAQVCLPLRFWAVVEPAPEMQQMALFAEGGR